MDSRRFTFDTALTLVAAYLGLFVGLIDANAINLALPAVRTDLGGGIAGAQWTIDAYNITFAALLLTSGSLGDRFGRRRILRGGLAAFLAVSLVCAVAPSLPVLLAARAVRLAPPHPVRSLREGTRAARLRSARTCYDHLAGRLGVQIMGSLLDREVLVGGDGRYDPSRESMTL
jgi:MFS transporter